MVMATLSVGVLLQTRPAVAVYDHGSFLSPLGLTAVQNQASTLDVKCYRFANCQFQFVITDLLICLYLLGRASTVGLRRLPCTKGLFPKTKPFAGLAKRQSGKHARQ
jgi:hypothetical protein